MTIPQRIAQLETDARNPYGRARMACALLWLRWFCRRYPAGVSLDPLPMEGWT